MIKTEVPDYKAYTLRLIFFFTAVRIFIAYFVELGNDESYYWVYAQKLQWNYFDHPPLVALWTKLFTWNLLFESELALRTGSIAGCAIASWIVYKTVTELHSSRAGFFAACLYNTSLYAGLTAGVYLMPDSPQMVFWTACLYLLVCISKDEKSWKPWMAFGIAAGLCVMCKVHGGFIWIGLGMYILLLKRAWLKLPQLYVAAALTLLLISPILIWNIQNDFVTYRFHSQRVVIENNPFKQLSFHREVFHQLLWNNPFNVILIVAAIVAFFRQKIARHPALSIFLFIGIPFALTLLCVSLFRDTVLIHWSGPAYVSLIPVAAIYLASKNFNAFPRVLKWNMGLLGLAIILWIGLVEFYPGNLGRHDEERLGQGDLSLDIYGWNAAGKEFRKLYERETSNGTMPQGTPLVCAYWWGAHVEYYFSKPVDASMIGLGSLSGLHHYGWTNAWRIKGVDAEAAYCIMPSDDNYQIPAPYYQQLELATTIRIQRSGKPAHNFKVYRLKGLRKQIPVR